MRTTHACLFLLQLLASGGQATTPQCACRSTTTPQSSTMSPDVMTVATTTMAPVAENATTITTTMVAVATTAADEVAPSSGPSSGPVVPARLLRGVYIDDSDRQLQDEDNTSDASDNTTTTASQTMAPTETSDAALCDCPLPQVVSTFATTLTLASADDLAQLDFAELASQLASDLSWGDSAEVEVAHIVKIGVQYTLDVDITEAQCKAAVATAYSVLADDVECGDASSAPAPASSPASAPAPAPASAPGPAPAPERRLQSVTAVTISFDDVQLATAAATASQDTTEFTTALAGEGVTAEVQVSETVGVSVELTFTVTADEAIAEPTADALVSAVSSTTTDAITVTAAITSQVSVTYTRMPCSESDICDGTGGELVALADSIGCDGETCTTEERDRCCANPVGNTGSAKGTCVLGSLSALFLWHFF